MKIDGKFDPSKFKSHDFNPNKMKMGSERWGDGNQPPKLPPPPKMGSERWGDGNAFPHQTPVKPHDGHQPPPIKPHGSH